MRARFNAYRSCAFLWTKSSRNFCNLTPKNERWALSSSWWSRACFAVEYFCSRLTCCSAFKGKFGGESPWQAIKVEKQQANLISSKSTSLRYTIRSPHSDVTGVTSPATITKHCELTSHQSALQHARRESKRTDDDMHRTSASGAEPRLELVQVRRQRNERGRPYRIENKVCTGTRVKNSCAQ